MIKDEVLKVLEDNKGEYISGSKLALKLNVSRTAVWKTISQLIKEGYDIQSEKKSGYRLNQNSDILSVVKIRQSLSSLGFEPQLKVYKTIDSTNKQIKLEAVNGAEEWLTIVSEEQTQGKGRKQCKFISPTSKGVYMSVLLKPLCDLSSLFVLTKMSAVAVIEAIRDITGTTLKIKAPNDIVYNGKKLCGILTEAMIEAESSIAQFAVIGIGINVYGTDADFTEQESHISTSLSEITGRYCNRSEIIASVISHLYSHYKQYSLGSFDKITEIYNSLI